MLPRWIVITFVILAVALPGQRDVKGQESFDCGQVTEIPLHECEALVVIGEALHLGTDVWFGDNTPCDWDGLTCEKGHVSRMNIMETGSGELPGAIGDLSELTYLRFGDMGLSGTLPPEIGRLTKLETITVDITNLTSPLPDEIYTLPSLRSVSFWYNPFDEPLSPDWARLPNLEYLSFDETGFYGPIPPEWGHMPKIKTIILTWMNEVNGPIPPELGYARSLETFSVQLTGVSGGVPRSFGRLTNLKSLVLGHTNLSGPLPWTLVRLDLEQLRFDDTQLCERPHRLFQAWLDSIPVLYSSGIICGSAE